MVQSAMDPNNDLKVKTVTALLKRVELEGNREDAAVLQREIEDIQPILITNKIRNSKDKAAARIIQLLAEKYLMIQPVSMGGISYDTHINAMVSRMIPLAHIDDSNEMVKSVKEIAERISSAA
jgi:hypothetical protein